MDFGLRLFPNFLASKTIVGTVHLINILAATLPDISAINKHQVKTYISLKAKALRH